MQLRKGASARMVEGWPASGLAIAWFDYEGDWLSICTPHRQLPALRPAGDKERPKREPLALKF